MLWLGLEGRKKIKSLESDLITVRDDLERYVRACKQLETEWLDTLDRVNHFMGRAVARQRRGGQQAAPQEVVEPELAHLDPVSRDIMRWRKHRGGQQ